MLRRHPFAQRSWTSLVVAVLLSLTWFALVMVQSLAQKVSRWGQAEWWPAASLWRLALGAPLYLAIIPLAWMVFTQRRKPLRWSAATGWRLPASASQWVWFALLIGAACTGFADPGAGDKLHDHMGTVVLALVALQPPVVEETLMRGLFVHVMDRGGWERWVTTLVGAVCFALWHVVSFGPSGWMTGLVSIPLMFIPRYLTGGVLASVLIHLLLNGQIGNGYVITAVSAVELLALAVYTVRWFRRRAS